MLISDTPSLAEADAFSNVFSSLRGSGHMNPSSVKASLRERDNITNIGKYQIRLEDDEPFGDDPGGWHVTVWEWHQGDYYLQHRYPAQTAYEKTQGRKTFYLSTGKYIKGGDRVALRQWLEQRI